MSEITIIPIEDIFPEKPNSALFLAVQAERIQNRRRLNGESMQSDIGLLIKAGHPSMFMNRLDRQFGSNDNVLKSLMEMIYTDYCAALEANTHYDPMDDASFVGNDSFHYLSKKDQVAIDQYFSYLLSEGKGQIEVPRSTGRHAVSAVVTPPNVALPAPIIVNTIDV